MPRFCRIGKRIYPGFAAGGPEQSLQIQPGGGTPQGGFSRPLSDSPSTGSPSSAPVCALGHLPPGRGKAGRAVRCAAPTAPFEPFGTGGSGTCAEGGDLPPHPPRIRSAPPPKGKAFGRPQGSPLRRIRKQQHFSRRGRSQTGPPGFVPGALARQTQAQILDRTSGNFCTPRAQWPGGNSDRPLRFCAPEKMHGLSGGRPP